MNRRRLAILIWSFVAIIMFSLAKANADPLGNWQWRSPLPQGNALNAIISGKDTVVAVGDTGTIMTSSDGMSWTVRPTPTSYDLNGIAYGNDTFVAVGDSGTILISPDGIEWTVQPSPISGTDLTGIAYGNNAFVASGTGSRGVITSTDGVAWSYYGLRSTYSDSINFFRITYSNNTFFTMGWENCSGWCNSTGDESPVVYSSPDGISWIGPLASSEYPSLAGDGYGVVFGNGVYLKTDYWNDSVSVSSDAVTWTQVSLPSPSWDLGKIYFVHETFYVLGGYGYMATSSDGVKWKVVTSRPLQYIKDITFGDGIWVAVGGTAISTSEDGVFWTLQYTTSDTDHDLRGIAYGNNTLVAVGRNDTVLTSYDGKNWTQQISTTFRGFEDVSFGNGVFVGLTVGNGRSTVMTSSNGKNWTEGVSGFGFGSHITFGNGIFVAISPTSPGLVHTSSDGMTWTAHNLGVSPSGISDIVFGNDIFVIVGSAGFIFRSHDGVKWSSAQSVGIHHPNGGVSYEDLNSVTFGDGAFVAVGGRVGGIIASSPDGINWSTRESITNQALTSVAYVNHTFMASYNIGISVADGVFIGGVIQSASIKDGDTNHDGQVDLSDAVLTLQVVTGVTPQQAVYRDAGVNGEGKISLADAIYILQKAALSR